MMISDPRAMRRRIVIACAVLLAIFDAGRAKASTILFVGNSFTHGNYSPQVTYNASNITDANGTGYGGIPGIFKQLTTQAGLNYSVTIEAVSSWSLVDHYANKSSIIGQKWDTVVLQEQSTTPLPAAHGGDPTSFYSAASNLKNRILSKNSIASTVLYETWASPTTVGTNNYSSSTTGLHEMQADLQESYFKAYYDLGFSSVARVGDGFINAVDQGLADPTNAGTNGEMDLWGADNRHPSAWGSYLSAAILFSKITGYDTRTLTYSGSTAAAGLGISSANATQLNQLAYQINSLANPAPGSTPPIPSPKAIADAGFAGSFAAGSPEVITGNATVTRVVTSEGTFSNLIGATASGVTSTNTPSSIGTAPANANAAGAGLTINDGINNLNAGYFQFSTAGPFNANTRFFIIESTPSSSSPGDATTVKLIDANNNVIGTFALALTASDFGGSVATVTYAAGQASQVSIQSKLGGVTFSLADLGVIDFSEISTATGLYLSSSTLDPNVVGMFVAPDPSTLISSTAFLGTATLGRRRSQRRKLLCKKKSHSTGVEPVTRGSEVSCESHEIENLHEIGTMIL